MANPTRMDALVVSETIRVPEDGISAQNRGSILRQEQLQRFPVPLTSFRTWDAAATNLPGTAATDDLGLINGTWGTHPLKIQAGDLKAAGSTTRYARCEACLPECYEAAESVSVIISAGMVTTIADNACTVDIEVYKRDKIGGISADLCATAAQSINNISFADKSFVITSGSLNPGDVLDIRVAITCNDAATATAVVPTIGGFDLACDIKG